MTDALKESMLVYAPALAADYDAFVRRQFKAIIDDLGPELKGVYRSSRWARSFQAIRDSLHQEVSSSYRSSTYSLDESKLKQNAKRYGEQVSLEWYGKLRAKLGELENVTVSPPNRGGDVVVTGNHKDDKVRIVQQRIFKVSQLGTPFHQFPARIYVNGKFMSEDSYKKVVRGWNVPVVVREQKPKREPIDVDSRPKIYYFTYLVDFPKTQYREASVNSKHRDSAKGMSMEEALAKLKKNEERFDRDYPPNQRRILHDFELDTIYAWNNKLIWRKPKESREMRSTNPFWQDIHRLYDKEEKVDPIYDSICNRMVIPTHFANTELSCDYSRNTHSRCNIALKLPCGHIVVDDCSKNNLNGRTFKNETEWRKVVISAKMNPLTKVHPLAIEAKKKWKEDTKAGHGAGKEYWAGYAGAAYLLSNPRKKSINTSDIGIGWLIKSSTVREIDTQDKFWHPMLKVVNVKGSSLIAIDGHDNVYVVPRSKVIEAQDPYMRGRYGVRR